MLTRLLPSVRPRSMYGRHMWPLDQVSGNAISVFRKPEIAELIHPAEGTMRPGEGRREGSWGTVGFPDPFQHLLLAHSVRPSHMWRAV